MIKIQNKQQLITLLFVMILSVLIVISFIWFSIRQENASVLTPEERSLPPAASQTFLIPEPQITEPGTLIVDSVPEDARVVIDTAEEEGGGENSRPVPVNMTPFRVDSIPAGSHHLLISKQGYEYQEMDVTINPGEITRITITLSPQVLPQPPVSEWKSKLPIITDKYSITYSDEIGILIVIKPQSNGSEVQYEVQELSDEIKDRLDELKVPRTSERITWRIE